MKGAEDEFGNFLETIPIQVAETSSIIFNLTADISTDPEEIRSIMARQLCNPVRWYDTMMRFMEQQVEMFVEIGPGNVLSGLLKKTLPTDYPCKIYNINSLKRFEQFMNEVG